MKFIRKLLNFKVDNQVKEYFSFPIELEFLKEEIPQERDESRKRIRLEMNEMSLAFFFLELSCQGSKGISLPTTRSDNDDDEDTSHPRIIHPSVKSSIWIPEFHV